MGEKDAGLSRGYGGGSKLIYKTTKINKKNKAPYGMGGHGGIDSRTITP
jgi:hypothetical protein